MKNLKLLILLVSISLVSFSCGSDDDNDSGSNSGSGVLVYGDTEIQLKAGTIENYGEYSNGLYNFDIVLISSEISNTSGEPEAVDETFSGVYFELFTNNAADLAEGTYSFGDIIEINSYTYANVIIDSTLDNFNEFEINSGTFTVLDDGSSYEFEFEGTVSNGTSFSGYYEGSLTSYDYSSELDRSATSDSRKTRRLFNR